VADLTCGSVLAAQRFWNLKTQPSTIVSNHPFSQPDGMGCDCDLVERGDDLWISPKKRTIDTHNRHLASPSCSFPANSVARNQQGAIISWDCSTKWSTSLKSSPLLVPSLFDFPKAPWPVHKIVPSFFPKPLMLYLQSGSRA
jgi:hypothetical protein